MSAKKRRYDWDYKEEEKEEDKTKSKQSFCRYTYIHEKGVNLWKNWINQTKHAVIK